MTSPDQTDGRLEFPSDPDREFSAHLERGWEALQEGDLRSARLAVDECLQLRDDAAEAFSLLAQVQAAEGQPELALESFERAIEADDSYFEAMVDAAELALHALGNAELALEWLEDAGQVAETEDERADLRLLRAESFLVLGRRQDARREVERAAAQAPSKNETLRLAAVRLLVELESFALAHKQLDELVQLHPTRPEIHYLHALLLGAEGKEQESIWAHLRARRLLHSQPRPDWSLQPESMDALVLRVLASLEQPYGRAVANAVCITADWPGVEAMIDGLDPMALVALDAERALVTAGDDGSGDDAQAAPGLSPSQQIGAGGNDYSADGHGDDHGEEHSNHGGDLGADEESDGEDDGSLPAIRRVFVYQRSLEQVARKPERIEDVLREALKAELDALKGNDALKTATGEIKDSA